MSTQQAAITARIDGDKIVIGSVYDEARAAFLGSLPNAKWDRKRCCWTCTLTPACAWRLVSRDDADCAGDLEEIANEFRTRLLLRSAIESDTEPEQPYIRKGNDWRHQASAYAFSIVADATMFSICMGGGKSRLVVNLLQNRDCKKILIACPMSVTRVWPNQFAQHAALPFKIEVLGEHGTTKKLLHAKSSSEMAYLTGERLVLVVNYESAWRDPLGEWIKKQEWDAIVADESHRLRGHNSSVSKFFGKLYGRAKLRLCLTGTPMAVPFDVFGQYRFLDPGVYGTSWHAFQHRYAVMNKFFPSKVEEWQNQDELAERFSTIAYQVDSSVLDLPEVLHERRVVTLSPEAQKIYDDLEAELCAEVGAETVTAANALVKVIKLREVTSGFVIHDDSSVSTVVDHSKAEALRDILEDIGSEPVVVFCVFRHELRAVQGVCETLGKQYGELSGSDKGGLTDRGTMGPDIDVLGAQIQSGGVGIDLTRARYAIYYSVDFDPILYKQSLARVHRPGQERPVVYFHLLAENTIDFAVYGALERKESVTDAVLKYLGKNV